MTLNPPPPIREISAAEVDEAALLADEPWVVRGLAKDWPLVEASHAPQDFVRYLNGFYQGKPVCAFLGEPQHGGRFFYKEDMSALNFVVVDTGLNQVTDKLLALQDEQQPPTLYVGSTHIDTWLPGLRVENDLPMLPKDALVSLWMGNRSRIAAHFDYPRNLAICVMGQRRFTVFPPEQVENLYIGPWDLTPAGQPISLVDFTNPDLSRFPRFEQAWQSAMTADLEPGDAVYLPGMWWHQVESLAAINGLINYWWSETPAVYGTPTDAFNHALLSIRAMPRQQRQAWRAFFDHYVFAEDDSHLEHLPVSAQGRLGPLGSNEARQLRSQLINALKR